MTNKPILTLFPILLVFLCVSAFGSDIVHIGALNSKIIVIHFDDGYVRYHQKGESRSNEWVISDPLDVEKAVSNGNYEISGAEGIYSNPQHPQKITRKSKGTEYTWLCQNYSSSVGCINNDPDHAEEHWIYLHLSEPLEMGKTYTVKTNDVAGNGNEWKLEFSLEKNRTEAIHVNLVGYDPHAPKKYGYVYHWSGEDGGIDFSDYEGNRFYIINTKTKEKAYSGKLYFRKNKRNNETAQTNDTPDRNFLGADVYECNFSDFNTPGEYILAVDGIGCSFPFKIKDNVYRLPYYTSIRGLYHNRSGIALEEPYTDFTRPAPHNPLVTPGFAGKLKYTTSRFVDWTSIDNSDADKPAIEDGILGPIDTWGWYQDAGDWDGYFSHMKIPAMLMLTWEIAPEKFGDGELNIPEGVNQIPDILDEASWLIKFYQRTRHAIMDKGYGTGGIGSRVAPDWFGHAPEGNPSYLDNGQWVISGEDPFTTYFYAGLAAHFQLVLNKLGIDDPDSIDWLNESIEAYEWAENNTKEGDTNPNNVHGIKLSNFKMYAATTLFRLTGEEKYKSSILETGSNIKSSAVIDEDQKWAAYALITGNENAIGDDDFMAKVKGAVIATAEQKYNSVELRACRYGGSMYMPMLIGQGTTPRVFEIMMGHFLSKDFAPTKTNNYLAAIYTTADYFLGTNPLNMTYITHVGVRYPERVMHLDSWYSETGEIIPGITPYGPWKDDGKTGPTGPWDLHWPYKTLYPEGIENWPGHERWFNNYTTPVNAEFTVHQNTILSAVVYGYLCDEPDGSFEPNKRPSVGINSPVQDDEIGGAITIDVEVSDPNGEDDIAWVEYYNEWHKIGQSNEAPFDFTWKRPIYGKAKLSAKVVDKSGFSAKSEVVDISVKPLEYDVKIIVKDSLKNSTIENCAVTILDSVKTTDENGEAAFNQVSGLFGIQFEQEGYYPMDINELSIYSDTTLIFYLQQKKSEVVIIVHDRYNGQTFQGIPVIFNSEQKLTDQYGEVVFNVYEGSYNYLIEKNSFETEAGTFEIISDTTFHLFLVRTEAEIKFVLKEDNTPVNDATVVLNAQDSINTSSLGIARFKTQSVQNTFEYSIYKSGYYDVSGSLFLQTDTTVQIQMKKIEVGIGEYSDSKTLRIWPNPVTKELFIQSSEKISTVSLYSISGNKLLVAPKKESETLMYDLSSIQSGIYLLKVEFINGDFKMSKLVKN